MNIFKKILSAALGVGMLFSYAQFTHAFAEDYKVLFLGSSSKTKVLKLINNNNGICHVGKFNCGNNQIFIWDTPDIKRQLGESFSQLPSTSIWFRGTAAACIFIDLEQDSDSFKEDIIKCIKCVANLDEQVPVRFLYFRDKHLTEDTLLNFIKNYTYLTNNLLTNYNLVAKHLDPIYPKNFLYIDEHINETHTDYIKKYIANIFEERNNNFNKNLDI